jgi:leucyl/phenylalanyl-tRNA---protein transferase
MPLFRLSSRIEFPPVWLARSDGLLCIGGDLSSKRLLHAYENGIFPWFSKNDPILWWSPDPRLVLYPKEINISKSLKKKIKKNEFDITMDQAFEKTITACARTRKDNDEGAWLVDEMIQAYIELHQKGYAHSIETWQNGDLVGGLYGICLGGSFFGESMFSFVSNASKLALVALSQYLEKYDFDLIDCQVTTGHLINMGAVEISRHAFIKKINKSVQRKDLPDIWKNDYKIKLLLGAVSKKI